MKKALIIFVAGLMTLMLGMAMAEETETDPTIQEGYTVENEGWTSVVSWCKNGEMNIYGKFYYPKDFDTSKSWPTVIMSHGLGSRAEMVERAQWPQAAVAQGFVVYAYDFCGGGTNSNSDGDFYQMSVKTEMGDLNAVMDFVKSHDFVDADNLFLLGQSQGGFVSAMVAGQRPEEVRAMILVYPALCLVDDLHTFVPDLNALTGEKFESAMGMLGVVYAKDAYDIDVIAEISKYPGDVLIIHGLNDKTVPLSYSIDAITSAYGEANSELLVITGKKSIHGFEMVYEEGRNYALQAGTNFLNDHLGKEH